MDDGRLTRIEEQLGSWGREDFHALRKAVDATAITVAVMQERQKANGETMRRVEGITTEMRDLLRTQNSRLSTAETKVAVLESRESDGRAGGKWGALMGAFISALIAGLAAFFGKGGGQ